jgi:hypothetical protein
MCLIRLVAIAPANNESTMTDLVKVFTGPLVDRRRPFRFLSRER